jgi:hypothetical protein
MLLSVGGGGPLVRPYQALARGARRPSGESVAAVGAFLPCTGRQRAPTVDVMRGQTLDRTVRGREDRREPRGRGGDECAALGDASKGREMRETDVTEGVATGPTARGVTRTLRALAALEAGADAVSCFTAFITQGPTFPRRVNRALLDVMEKRGLRRLEELRAPA